jgi:Nucleotidyl transferase of unknown function (DUF2204)
VRMAKDRADKLPVTSSTPLRLPAKQQRVFRDVLALFESMKLPYTVAGAFALRQHTGICRFTKDLDIFLAPSDITTALRLLEDNRFRCEIPDPVWIAKAHRDGFFVDLISGMSNGVITVDSSWIERSIPATVVGIKTRVLAPEELIASKLFITRRERFDGADLVHLIYSSRGSLRWPRILELAGDHWEIVLWNLVLFHYIYPAQSTFVPQWVWESLLARFGGQVRSPDPHARFRGSLIDHRMFAIDTREWGLPDMLRENVGRRRKIGTSRAKQRGGGR